MRITIPAASLLALSAIAFAQDDSATIDRALAAAPRQMREAATVVRFKPGATYDTLKKGTNQLICYDRSGEPGRQPFAAQCTVLANLPRLVQNRKFEAITDRKARQAALDEAEKNGTRIKPEYGSVWIDFNGPDQAHAHLHTTIAVPGATSASIGLPENPKQGGAWLMNAGTSTAHIMTPGS